MKVKLEFYEEWKTKYKWLKETKHERKIVMKCIYDETHKATEPWGINIGFSTMHYDSLVVHSNSNIHKLLEPNWIYGIQRKAKPIT